MIHLRSLFSETEQNVFYLFSNSTVAEQVKQTFSLVCFTGKLCLTLSDVTFSEFIGECFNLADRRDVHSIFKKCHLNI